MKNTKYIILFIFLLLFFFACEDDLVIPSDPNPKDTIDVVDTNKITYDTIGVNYLGKNVIMPLNDGNYWEYKWWQFFSDSTQLLHRKTYLKDSLVVINNNEFNSLIQGTIEKDGSITKRITIYLYDNQNDGLRMVGAISPNDSVFLNNLYRKFPVEKGDSWEFIQNSYFYYEEEFKVIDTLNITCVGVDSMFITPIDTFYCSVYKYRIIENGGDYCNVDDHYQYYCPKVGLVGTEIYGIDYLNNDNAILYLRQELIKTNLVEYRIREK